jgi:hypothetical protein
VLSESVPSSTKCRSSTSTTMAVFGLHQRGGQRRLPRTQRPWLRP